MPSAIPLTWTVLPPGIRFGHGCISRDAPALVDDLGKRRAAAKVQRDEPAGGLDHPVLG